MPKTKKAKEQETATVTTVDVPPNEETPKEDPFPYHFLKTATPDDPPITFENSGLDWDIELLSCYGLKEDDKGEIERKIHAPNLSMITRKDSGECLGVHSAGYKAIPNDRIWETKENTLADVDHYVERTGYFGGGRTVFITCSVDTDQLVNGDKFQTLVHFLSSHDGKRTFCVTDSNVRIVCQNSFSAAYCDHLGQFRTTARHTKNAEKFILDMERYLENLFEKRDEYYDAMKFLDSYALTVEEAKKVLLSVEATQTQLQNGPSVQLANRVKNELDLFQNGTGNNGKTGYDLWNGVTEFHTHFFNPKKGTSRLESSEFDYAAKKKGDIYGKLCHTLDDATLDSLVKQGEKLLAAAEDNAKEILESV